MLFIQEVLCAFSYNGRGNKKQSFSKLMTNKLIFGKLFYVNVYIYYNITIFMYAIINYFL